MDLFNNPMVEKALKSMTPEDREEYKKMGEHMFGSVNFTDSKVINNLPPPVEEAVAYVEQGIKAGLLPEDLEPAEITMLHKALGDKWYEKYGFLASQIPKINLNPEKKFGNIDRKPRIDD
jgi:hypothetical protein